MSCHDKGRNDKQAIINLCGRFMVLEHEIKTIKENDLVHIQQGIDRVEGMVKKNWQKLDWMANRGIRPTWLVSLIITGLFSLCTGLVVAMVK